LWIPSESILRQIDYVDNMGKCRIRSPRLDVTPITSHLTLKFISSICNYTVNAVNKETHYDESQYFYSRLLKFYKEVYLQKRLSKVEPIEILGGGKDDASQPH